MPRKGISFAPGGERSHIAQVVAFARNDVAHAAARVIHIAVVARYDVNVKMHDRLPREAACVESNVVPVRPVLQIDSGLHLVDKGKHGQTLLLRGAEPVLYDAVGDDQRVPRRDRVAIAKRETRKRWRRSKRTKAHRGRQTQAAVSPRTTTLV